MPVNISGQSYLRLLDFSTEQIEYLLKLSKNFKDLKRTGTPHRYLEGKNIVLLFQKTSTRTRCAFEVGAMDLGMGVTYLDPGSSQMGKKESIEDTARVLGRFYDGIEFRGFAQSDRGGAGREGRRPGVERPDRRVASHPDARRRAHRAGELQLRHQGLKFVFFGDAAQQHGPLAHGRVRQARHELRRPAARRSCLPADELVETCEGIAAENGCTVKLHRRREGSRHGRRRHLHRRVGVHGRARRGVGRAHRAAAALSRDRGDHGHGEAGRPSSCTACRRSTTPTPPPAPTSPKRFGVTEMEVDRRRVRVQAVEGLRRGREPHAHHQGRHVRHAAVAFVPLR